VRYTRDLERAYLAMHERAARGVPPAAFRVPSRDSTPPGETLQR